MHFMQEANIYHPFEGAFSKSKQGMDHIFVANTLIDQAKHLNIPLYASSTCKKHMTALIDPSYSAKWSCAA